MSFLLGRPQKIFLRCWSAAAARARIIAFAVSLACIGTAGGHDISRSESLIEVHGREVDVVLRLDLLALRYVDANGDDRVSYDELDNAIDRIYADVRRHYILGS